MKNGRRQSDICLCPPVSLPALDHDGNRNTNCQQEWIKKPWNNGNTGNTSNFGGNVYVDLNMNVDSISSDYDVDRLVNRVKQDIYDASAYRNINVISDTQISSNSLKDDNLQ